MCSLFRPHWQSPASFREHRFLRHHPKSPEVQPETSKELPQQIAEFLRGKPDGKRLVELTKELKNLWLPEKLTVLPGLRSEVEKFSSSDQRAVAENLLQVHRMVDEHLVHELTEAERHALKEMIENERKSMSINETK